MDAKNHIGRIVLLVKDYDEELSFYQKNFNCKLLVDYKADGQRVLHVGFDTDDAIGIWFLKADADDQQSVGHQTGGQPTFVIYTNALNLHYKKLLDNGVTIKRKPVYTQPFSFFHCYDLYGNEIIVTELNPE